jgi:ABC-type branched-subunit amino acid transport system ATPase component
MRKSYLDLLKLSWFKKAQDVDQVHQGSPALYVKSIVFANGTTVELEPNSIVALTGANNVGKSSVLREVDNSVTRGYGTSGPIVRKIEISSVGSVEQFRDFVERRSLKTDKLGEVLIGRSRYELKKINEDITRSFRGSPVSELFCSRLSASRRLAIVGATRREDWTRNSPTEPIQWLDVDIEAESELSNAFRRAFGLSLFVNRTAGDKLTLHVSADDQPDFESFRDYMSWFSRIETLEQQGDGMKSFAAALMSLKIHPKSLLLLDEPEAFLHHPQARKLAEIITRDTAPHTQIWLATHSDEIVRGLLDHTNDRIVLIRLDRVRNTTTPKLLKAEQVKTLWADPLLRTSDVLSSLFHELAIICEGESDVRFFRTLVDADANAQRLPDLRFYHVGGKDKIVSIVSALKLVDMPVCILVDIDILSDVEKFLKLFEALGGHRNEVSDDIRAIVRHVGQQKPTLSSKDVSLRLTVLAEKIQGEHSLSSESRRAISALAEETTQWGRIKEDGYRGFANATIIQAFDRVYDKCKVVGMLINREGELEGLCRDISKKPKSTWLAEVLNRDLMTDPSLDDARKMLRELRECINYVRPLN